MAAYHRLMMSWIVVSENCSSSGHYLQVALNYIGIASHFLQAEGY